MAEVEGGECSCISARVLHLAMMDVLLMSCRCSFLHDDDAILPATTGTRNIFLVLLFEVGSLLAMVVVNTADKDLECNERLGVTPSDSEYGRVEGGRERE